MPAGSTYETAARALRRLSDTGAVRRPWRHVRIEDPGLLRSLAAIPGERPLAEEIAVRTPAVRSSEGARSDA